MRQTAQEEAYRKLDEMAAKLTETLRKSAKMVCNMSDRKIIFSAVLGHYQSCGSGPASLCVVPLLIVVFIAKNPDTIENNCLDITDLKSACQN